MSDLDKDLREICEHYDFASFAAGYNAALPKWIPIAEIPDEWKDGRRVFWLTESGTRHYEGRFGADPRLMINAPPKVTRAMLPPALPKGPEQ